MRLFYPEKKYKRNLALLVEKKFILFVFVRFPQHFK